MRREGGVTKTLSHAVVAKLSKRKSRLARSDRAGKWSAPALGALRLRRKVECAIPRRVLQLDASTPLLTTHHTPVRFLGFGPRAIDPKTLPSQTSSPWCPNDASLTGRIRKKSAGVHGLSNGKRQLPPSRMIMKKHCHFTKHGGEGCGLVFSAPKDGFKDLWIIKTEIKVER